MKDLSLDPTIDNTDGDFLNGKIKDTVTKPSEHISQDWIQTIEKIKDTIGDAPNGLFDNETNGYQLLEVLRKYIGMNGYLARRNSTGDYDEIISSPSESQYDIDVNSFLKYGRPTELEAVKIRVYVTAPVNETGSIVATLTEGGQVSSTDMSLLNMNDEGGTIQEFIVPVNNNQEFTLNILTLNNITQVQIKIQGYFYGRII